MTGIIYNTNTNVADDFSSCMVGYSNQYMLGTRIKIKIKDYINFKNIKIDEINSLILKISGSNSSMTCINVIDESNNNTKVIYKSNNIYEIDLKNYIKESLTDISLLLNYYDSQKYEEISYDGLYLDYTKIIVSSIYVKSPPNKIEYEYGESFDPTGLVVYATYSNGEEKEIIDYVIFNTVLNRNVNKIKITYNYNGIRTSKETSSNSITNYFYEGDKLVGMTVDGCVYQFVYGQNGVVGFFYNKNESSKNYYFSYIKNPYGDIVGLVNSDGIIVATYCYNEYGNILKENILDNNYSEIIHNNPFRYRGYVYDEETGLYYLITRYYDPKVMMFLTPDDENNYGVNNVNPYCYCLYDPINRVDPDGNFSILTILVPVITGAIISGGVKFLFEIIDNDWNFEEVNWKEVGIATLIGGISGGLSGLPGLGSGFGWFALNVVSSVGFDSINGDVKNWREFLQSLVSAIISSGLNFGVSKLLSIGVSKITNKILNYFPNIKSDVLINTLTEGLIKNSENHFSKNVIKLTSMANNKWYCGTISGEIFTDIVSEIFGKIKI